jgi:carbonic anhydrase/acetyltransferase-like protein (isoleucine patch superfamily)
MVNLEILKQAIGKGKEVFIADTARVIGNITLGDEVSIWFGAVLRGDGDKISIGNRSNIQDNATVHVDPGFPVEIGEECIIGHGAVVHGAKISNNVLIGIHATVLNGAQIGSYSIVAAGALVTEGMIIPSNSLVVGVPGRIIRTIGAEQMEKIKKNSESYVKLSKIYLEKFSN